MRGIETGTTVGTGTEIDQVIGVVMAIEDGRTIIAQDVVKIATVPFLRKTVFPMDVIPHRRPREIDFYECSNHL